MVRLVDISPYISGHKANIEAEDKRREKFYNEAMIKAKRIAEEFIKAYPGVEVWLFGSLTSDLYELSSDIDLAIKGLPEEEYYKALKIAEFIAKPITVDLVQVEFASETLGQKIERDGVSL